MTKNCINQRLQCASLPSCVSKKCQKMNLKASNIFQQGNIETFLCFLFIIAVRSTILLSIDAKLGRKGGRSLPTSRASAVCGKNKITKMITG